MPTGTASRFVLVGLGAVLVALAAAHVVGIYINLTVSIPRGIYRATDAPAATGSLVVICPPDVPIFKEARARGYVPAGFCAGGYTPLMKRALAAKGDRIVVNQDGVYINGKRIPASAQRATDGLGRALPALRLDRVLQDDEMLFMGENSDVSFDGRYFGPMQRSQIKTVISAVITW